MLSNFDLSTVYAKQASNNRPLGLYFSCTQNDPNTNGTDNLLDPTIVLGHNVGLGGNQLASSLLTTCSRLVIIKPEQAM